MDYLDKLKLLVATYGKAKTAEMLGFHIVTLSVRIKNPGTFRLSEIEAIDRLSEEAKSLPIK